MQSKKNLLVGGSFDRGSFKELSAGLSAYANIYWLDELSTPDLEKLLPSIECLLIGLWPHLLDEKRVSKMKSLRFIQVESAGVDRIPFKLLGKNVIVCSNSGSLSPYIAEHAWALILAAAKKIVKFDRAVKEGVFEETSVPEFFKEKSLKELAEDLPVMKDRTLGIIGYGSIGRQVAAIGRAFGMKICAFGRSDATDAVMFQGKDGLLEMLSQSDVVVSTIPLTSLTSGMIGAQELAAMKPHAILVNVSRGDIIKETDLYAHLSKNPRFTFATDVWWYVGGREPFSSRTPLLSLDNFIGTPHIAGFGGIAVSTPAKPAVDNLLLYLKGGSPDNVIKRSDYA